MRRLRFVLPAMVVVLALFAASARGNHSAGFKTSRPSMITVLSPAKPTVPIITTGETLAGGYRFESIPDGIGISGRNGGHGEILVNHETSTVPFPFNPPFGGSPPTEANQNDFENSQVSRLELNRQTAGVISGSYAISSSENYHRFCTSYLATEKESFSRPIYFANEEAQDWVFRTGTSWPGPTFIPPGTHGAEQTGVTVAYDVRTGARKVIYGMGRLNHENTVAIPGYGKPVTLTTDDTFFTTQLSSPYKPAWSQLYSYIAPSTNALWNDRGDLWAFVSDTEGYDDYFDFAPGDKTVVDGHFVKVPKAIATGKNPATGAEWLSKDFPGMLPPPSVSGAPPDGPQWVLDQWGNKENNGHVEVFRFVRLEDVAYDKRPHMSNVVYIADSGRASRAPTGNVTPQQGLSTNGRVWKLVLDPKDPTKAKLSILVEGDDNLSAADDKAGAFNEIHQPDNVETTSHGSLLVQEDPSSANQYALPREANETPARIWRIDLAAANPDESKATVAEVDQSLDETTDYDVDAAGRASLGNWESSGIVDASAIFGPGAFLVTIQAHSLWIQKADGPDGLPPEGKDFTFKREGGQLTLIYLDPSW